MCDDDDDSIVAGPKLAGGRPVTNQTLLMSHRVETHKRLTN